MKTSPLMVAININVFYILVSYTLYWLTWAIPVCEVDVKALFV